MSKVLKGQGRANLIAGWLDNLTKIHPLTLPIPFGMDVELLPHARVISDTISRQIQAGYSIPYTPNTMVELLLRQYFCGDHGARSVSIPQLCKSVPCFQRVSSSNQQIFTNY